MNEQRADIVGKPVSGLPVATAPLLMFTVKLNRLCFAVGIVLLIGLLVLDQR